MKVSYSDFVCSQNSYGQLVRTISPYRFRHGVLNRKLSSADVFLCDPAAAGTLTSDGLNSYSYDGEARLHQVNGGITYLYGPEGERVAKQASGAIQEQYLYSPDGTLTTTLSPDS